MFKGWNYDRPASPARRSAMDFDPVLLGRLQFAFTIIFHIIFPSFTIGLSAYIATLGVVWLRTGDERYHRLMRFWTKIFAVSFAMGVVSGIVLSYQFGTNWSRFSVVAGNVVGPLARLRGADRFLPGGDLPRRPAVRLQPRAALALCAVGGDRRGRHRDLGVLDPLRQQLDADAGRLRDASDGVAYPIDWLRRSFQSELPLSLRAHAQRRLPHHRLRRAGGRRALSARRPAHRGRPHHAAHGDRADSRSWRRCNC